MRRWRERGAPATTPSNESVQEIHVKRQETFVQRRTMFLALLLSIGAAVSPLSWADALSHSRPTATQALSQVLTQAVERNDTPGVVGLVVDRKGILFEGAAGKLDAAGQTALPVNAIFNIASMTKPVTSVAVMMLLEQGKLSLDDP